MEVGEVLGMKGFTFDLIYQAPGVIYFFGAGYIMGTVLSKEHLSDIRR